jgi:hypothetical protein
MVSGPASARYLPRSPHRNVLATSPMLVTARFDRIRSNATLNIACNALATLRAMRWPTLTHGRAFPPNYRGWILYESV